MMGPESTITFAGAAGMNALPSHFFGARGEVAAAAVVASEQVLSQLPGARLSAVRQVRVQAGANHFGLRHALGLGHGSELSGHLFVESQRDRHPHSGNTVSITILASRLWQSMH